MKFKVICVVVILASFLISSEGLPFSDFGLASVSEYEVPADELNRDKRTLTTICVEIKPSSPYEEPYFMCKGTDSPKYSKGSTSDSYSSKPSYKPSKTSTYSNGESDSYHSGVKKNNDYHTQPSQPEYHAEHSKYDKPTSAYDSGKEYSLPSKSSYDKNPSYGEHGIHHNYEIPSKPSSYASAKPSYADHHDSQDDYAIKHHQAHKVTYEKPSISAYSSKPQAYSHENPLAYDHRQPAAGYSKPSSYESHTASGGYSKPSSSYEPTEYSKPSSYDQSSAHDSNPSYNGESHSKPSYGGNDGHSYSAPPETKVLYSKPASYPAKHISYEHADNEQYGQPKPSYTEQPPAKPYSKPTQDYGKPGPYATNEQHSSGYAPQQQNYRMMPQELMQPTWETQPPSQQLQYDGFGYRSYGAAMEYQNLETPRMVNHESQPYTGLEGPLRFDLSDADQEAPTLQSPYPHQTYSSPALHGPSYRPIAPSYAPPVHYAAAAPSYPTPAYPSAAPSYTPVSPPSYAPLPVPSPTYTPAVSSYAPIPSSHRSQLPPCRQNYMYSFQPVIMSVPCYSLSGSYGSASYGQSLGAPAIPQNVHSSNLNPLQDHSSTRSEGNSEPSAKSAEDHSGSQESHESDKKSDSEVETSQTTAKKSENLKKPSEIAEENQHQHQQVDKNSQDHQVVGVEKPKNEAQNIQTAGVAPSNNPEVPNTKEAFNAMMKMARIAAQLNKDDTNKGPTDGLTADGGSATLQGNEKSSGALPQFSRS